MSEFKRVDDEESQDCIVDTQGWLPKKRQKLGTSLLDQAFWEYSDSD